MLPVYLFHRGMLFWLRQTITVLENLELVVQVYSWPKQRATILSKKRQGTLTCNGD